MIDKKRETVGKVARDLMLKEPESRDPIELEREMHKDFEHNVELAVDTGKKNLAGDFYVVVLTKKEKLLPNVIRNYFFSRQSCPTPDFDQAVYRYNRFHDYLEFMWVIPSRDTCELFRSNALQIDPKERELLRYVLDFYDDTLLRLSKKLNGEEEHSNILA